MAVERKIGNITAIRRVVDASEVANLAVFLCSPLPTALSLGLYVLVISRKKNDKDVADILSGKRTPTREELELMTGDGRKKLDAERRRNGLGMDTIHTERPDQRRW